MADSTIIMEGVNTNAQLSFMLQGLSFVWSYTDEGTYLSFIFLKLRHFDVLSRSIEYMSGQLADCDGGDTGPDFRD